MNEKIIILIAIASAIGIALSIVVLVPTQNKTPEEKILEELGVPNEINSMLKKIQDDRKANEQSDNRYYPQEREWVNSGPFNIDRNEYWLGEKLFLNLDYMDRNTKGTMIFSKIVNDTHSYNYKKINFDGSKYQQNFYLGFNLNSYRGLCTADQLIGDWELIFEGTNYESIKFKVLDKIIPGHERQYVPQC